MRAPLLPVDVTIASCPDVAGPPLPPPLVSDDPRSFAWGVMHRRHPALIEQVRAAHPYGPRQHAALDALAQEATTGLMSPLRADAPDSQTWAEWGKEYFGQPWDRAPFLWAESYFYRRLLDAVDFFTPGPWFWIDPFEHLKTAELHDPGLEKELLELERLPSMDPNARTEALLLASLWGNRADLGFKIGIQAATGNHEEVAGLVADDTAELLAHLAQTVDLIHLIADNAGRELLSDLILIDDLLRSAPTRPVTLHVKPSPYYVSDAVTADVAACLRRLRATPGEAHSVAARLTESLREGRLAIVTHWFYNAPYSFHHMPADLIQVLSGPCLTLVKGDLNYRRLVGDCDWRPTTPFADTTGYFPSAVGALRTLKSDVAVGIEAATVTEMDHHDVGWRTNGSRGLVQLRR